VGSGIDDQMKAIYTFYQKHGAHTMPQQAWRVRGDEGAAGPAAAAATPAAAAAAAAAPAAAAATAAAAAAAAASAAEPLRPLRLTLRCSLGSSRMLSTWPNPCSKVPRSRATAVTGIISILIDCH